MANAPITIRVQLRDAQGHYVASNSGKVQRSTIAVTARGAGGKYRSPTASEREDALRRIVSVGGSGGSGGPQHVRYIAGSNLPYASRWIESGLRDDPRYGRVNVLYRKPGYAHYMLAAARQVNGRVQADFSQDPPVVGVVVANLESWVAGIAEEAAGTMRNVLEKVVYSAAPRRYETRGSRGQGRWRTWERTHALYNSIRVQRLP